MCRRTSIIYIANWVSPRLMAYRRRKHSVTVRPIRARHSRDPLRRLCKRSRDKFSRVRCMHASTRVYDVTTFLEHHWGHAAGLNCQLGVGDKTVALGGRSEVSVMLVAVSRDIRVYQQSTILFPAGDCSQDAKVKRELLRIQFSKRATVCIHMYPDCSQYHRKRIKPVAGFQRLSWLRERQRFGNLVIRDCLQIDSASGDFPTRSTLPLQSLHRGSYNPRSSSTPK